MRCGMFHGGPLAPGFGPTAGWFSLLAAAGERLRSRGAMVCAVVFLLACSVGVATAADDAGPDLTELSFEELMQVKVLKVYGVSRYEQDAHEAPAQVTVVTAEDIQRYGYRFLSDILKGVAGLYVTDDRNYRYLGYRGFGLPGDYNSRALIMIDGVRLNDDVYHFAPIGFDFPLDLGLVERVEVVRGPSQAIYGNNAFLLVINVITKEATSRPLREVTLTVDSRGSMEGALVGGGPVAGGRLLLSGSAYHDPGSDLYFPAYDDPATNNGMARGCDYASGGRAFFKYSTPKLSLMGGYLFNRKVIPTAPWGTTFNDDASRTDDQRFFAGVNYQAIDAASASLSLRAYMNGYNYDGSYSYAPEPVYYDYSRSLSAGAELLATFTLPGRNRLVSGIDYRHGFQLEQGDSTGYRDSRTLDEMGIFVQNEFRPADFLILTAGMRYDLLEDGEQTINPKGAVVLLPMENLALKYLFGRSFRAPNAYERYYGANGFLPNPGLEEEVMYSHELVAEYQLDDRLRLTVTGFQYDYRNLVIQEIDMEGNSRFQNHGRLRAQGVETELSAAWKGWSGGIGHTYQETECRAGHTRPVPNSPRNLLKLRLSREMLDRRLILSGEAQYASRVAATSPGEEAPGVLVANLTLLGRDFLAKGLDASLSIYNLFDINYGQPAGKEHLPVALIPQNGISGALRISYRF